MTKADYHTYSVARVDTQYKTLQGDSIPLLDDVIKQESAEWLNILAMTAQERVNHQAYIHASLQEHNYIVCAEQKARKPGQHKKSLEVALQWLEQGMSLEDIQQITGLAQEKIAPCTLIYAGRVL